MICVTKIICHVCIFEIFMLADEIFLQKLQFNFQRKRFKKKENESEAKIAEGSFTLLSWH